MQTRQAAAATVALITALEAAPDALHYFDLKFLDDGPSLMPVNVLGAYVRSHALGLPFGDQGLCLSRTAFERLGGFDAQVPYGEDHVFVWRAGRQGMPLRCTGVPLYTSARKYQAHGWAPTTLRHLLLTYKQAVPELVMTWRKRLAR